jgi:hypothetical protein
MPPYAAFRLLLDGLQKPLKVGHLPFELKPRHFRNLDQFDYVRAAAADRAGGAVLDAEGDQMPADVLG